MLQCWFSGWFMMYDVYDVQLYGVADFDMTFGVHLS